MPLRVDSRWSWLLLGWVHFFCHASNQQPFPATLTQLEPPGEPFPDDRITCFMRDQYGMLWVGTHRGLIRYHFAGFRWYLPEPANPTALISGDVKELYEDSDGNFWVATIGGLHRMDRRNGTFERIPLRTELGDSLDERKIQVVFVDRRKRLWVGTDKGLFRFENSVAMHVGDSTELGDAWIAMISEDREGRLWVASFQSGFYVLSNDVEPSLQRVAESWPQRLNTVIRNENGTWWLGCHDGVYRHVGDPLPGEPEQAPTQVSSENVIALAWDGSSLWVGATRGAQRLWSDGRVQSISLPDSEDGSKHGVYQIYADSLGMVWVSFAGGGIYYWNQFQDHIKGNALENAEVWTLNGNEDSDLWVGTKRHGLWRLSKDLSIKNKYLEKHTIRDIAWDGEKRMWIGTDTGLFSFSPQEDAPIRYEPIKARVWSILPMDEMLWIGMDDGVWQIDPTTNSDKRREEWVQASSGASTGTITTLVSGDLGGVWVGSYANGLVYLNTTEQTHRVYNRQSNPAIPSNQVINVFLDKASNVWISSAAGGLSYINPEGRVMTFGLESDLARSAIVGICQDSLGRYWANASSGVIAFDETGKIIGLFGERDGVAHGSATPGSILAVGDDVWFGGINGLTHLNVLQLPEPPTTKVLVSSFRADGEELSQLVLPGETLLMPETKGTLALSLAQMDPFTYSWGSWHYRREDQEVDWIPMEEQQLQLGRYLPLGGQSTIQLKTQDHRQKPLTFQLGVVFEPPWWRAWLPIWGLAALLLVVFTTYLMVSHIERQRRKKLIEKAKIALARQKLAEEKAAIAEKERNLEARAREQHQIHMDVVQKHLEQVSAEMANDLHDGPLSELRGLGFQLSALRSSLGEGEGSQRLGALQEKLLPSIAGNLRKVCGELMLPSFEQGLLPEMESYLENLKHQTKILTIQTQWHFDESHLDGEAKRILFRIFRTLVKNVEDHAQASLLTISLTSREHETLLKIEDNGKGFGIQESYEVLRENKHYGLYMAQFFAEGLGGAFRITGQPGKGTTATVQIPTHPSESQVERMKP